MFLFKKKNHLKGSSISDRVECSIVPEIQKSEVTKVVYLLLFVVHFCFIV